MMATIGESADQSIASYGEKRCLATKEKPASKRRVEILQERAQFENTHR